MEYFTKYEFLDLMERKRGRDYVLGWLRAAYALPPVPLEDEMELIRKESVILEALPDLEEKNLI